MNVLSCFDGISGGQLALQRAGIKVDNYFASEIDKYAITVTQKNFPNTIQLGSIVNWREWNLPKIDILIGGSPCQGFSQAGLGLNFDDPRSKLFFVFVDLLVFLKEKNPDLKFMMENVKMKKEWRDIITEKLGVEPVLINSALLSAQNRERLYWANWTIEQPEDKGIFLKDIIESGVVNRDKSYAIDANYFKGGSESYLKRTYENKPKRQVVKYQSARRLQVMELDESAEPKPSENGLIFVGGLESGRRLDDGKDLSRNFREGYRIYSDQGKAAALSAKPKGGAGGYTGAYQISTKYRHSSGKMVEKDRSKSPALREAFRITDNFSVGVPKNGLIQIASLYKNNGDAGRIYSTEGKARTLKGEAGGGGAKMGLISDDGYHYRKLTPVECERLQTIPDGYTEGISNTQRYKCLGNGWTVDVIVHIFLQMNNSK